MTCSSVRLLFNIKCVNSLCIVNSFTYILVFICLLANRYKGLHLREDDVKTFVVIHEHMFLTYVSLLFNIDTP